MPPKTAATTDLEKLHVQVETLWDAAAAFVPTRRLDEMIRKWLSGAHDPAMTEYQRMAMVAHATVFSADLILSQPSPSGGTAFDRMARGRHNAAGAELAALNAVRASRYRLLQIVDPGRKGSVTIAKDLISGEMLHIAHGPVTAAHNYAVVFARVVGPVSEICFIPGAVCPIDAIALSVARQFPTASATTTSANWRWAEAVFGHVVRHGTLAIPEPTRPGQDHVQDNLFGCATIAGLMDQWHALGEAPADENLLQHTRQAADTPSLLRTLGGILASRATGQAAMARGCTRAALVMMETIARRHRCGSGGGLSLDSIAAELDDLIAHNGAPAGMREVFAALRKMLGSNGSLAIDDPALERVMQRIQALRAKTKAQGCTEAEAIAAAEKAAELLDKHGLSLNELEFAAQPCDGLAVATGRKRQKPIDRCVPAIACFFDCRVWQEKSPDGMLNYVFFGLRADVTAAHYLYEVVERAFETETASFLRSAVFAEMADERRTATTSFQLGLAHGIRTKLATLQAARATHQRSVSGRDLVQVKDSLVDAELDKLGLNLQKRHVGQRKQVLSDAFASGAAAGERFEWTDGISEAA